MEEDISDIDLFLEPSSVAIIGASRTKGKSGNTIVQNLLDLGFEGEIYPINPAAGEILGLKTYPSIEEVGRTIDLAVIAVPSKMVPDVMMGCATSNIKAVVLISSGFSEEGNFELEEEMLTIAKDAQIRIIGPNTTGVVNAYANFTTTFVTINRLTSGNVSFIVQTGVFAGMMLDHIVTSQRFGISKVIGLGNKCDVDDAEVISYLADDPETDVIGIYLEGVRDGRRFLDVAREVSGRKPIVVFKSGKTEAGARAAKSHTSSLTGNDEIFDSVCKQSGIIRADGFEDLMDFVKAFSFLPMPKGDRIAVISITGAGCVIGADRIQENGLKIAELSSETMMRMEKINPEWHLLTNPVDLWPAMEASGLDALNVAINAVIDDYGVDALVLVLGLMAGVPVVDPKKLSRLKIDKPMLVSALGNKDMVEEITKELEEIGFPVYSSIERAVSALTAICKFRGEEE